MTAINRPLILCVLIFFSFWGAAQRTYAPNSVLATGAWYQVSVAAEGIYKIDLPLLNSLGITGTIPSNAIRVFGKGGGMLPEANSAKPIDDLTEIAIWVEDGGDGTLNGNDYLLFYTPGPHQWVTDAAGRRFSHRKNLYSDKAYYYITTGANGLRIGTQASAPSPSVTVTSFDERYFHELDTVNFLASGKEWYGEEFSSAPGRTLTRNYNLPLTDLLPGAATLVTSVAARSVNAASRFGLAVNNSAVQTIEVNPVSTALYDVFAQQVQKADPFVLSQNTASVTINYNQGSFNSQGWLNWFELFCRRRLSLPVSKMLLFRDWNSVGGGTAGFQVLGADASAQVWEVTDPFRPVKMNTSFSGGTLQFANDASRLREYACFSGGFLVPQAVGRVTNQDLHNTAEKDFLIVTHPQFLSQAQRLVQFHQQRGLRTLVVTTEQVFHEFSAGIPDPTAIRDFVKMYYDRYSGTWNDKGKYLLLFGRASFDFKNRIVANTNYVPAFESSSSLDPLTTYTSDDFFGFLQDAEDINSGLVINTLDIGIGRIPAKNAEEAKNFVDKV